MKCNFIIFCTGVFLILVFSFANSQRGNSPCWLPEETGRCDNYTIKWFFSKEYNGCTRFWYGGCDGNENRFETQEDCERVCSNQPTTIPFPVTTTTTETPVTVPASCTDNSYFANCTLIVMGRLCTLNTYYATFCCKSCTDAGYLPVNRLRH